MFVSTLFTTSKNTGLGPKYNTSVTFLGLRGIHGLALAAVNVPTKFTTKIWKAMQNVERGGWFRVVNAT